MELYFLRHGKAEELRDGDMSDDFSRALTEKGIDELQAVAKALDRLGVRPDVIITSPLIRARQTAQIVAKRLGMKKELVEAELLRPGCDLDCLSELLTQYKACQRVILVGHEPDFSTLVGELIGGAGIEMKKGGLALVTIERSLAAGRGVLEWLIPPRILVGEAV